jgi:hypothetical protein
MASRITALTYEKSQHPISSISIKASVAQPRVTQLCLMNGRRLKYVSSAQLLSSASRRCNYCSYKNKRKNEFPSPHFGNSNMCWSFPQSFLLLCTLYLGLNWNACVDLRSQCVQQGCKCGTWSDTTRLIPTVGREHGCCYMLLVRRVSY